MKPNLKTKNRQYTGIINRFLVYDDVHCRTLLGHGYRIMYEPKKTQLVSDMVLLDNNDKPLPEDVYFLGDITDDELVVITETRQ